METEEGPVSVIYLRWNDHLFSPMGEPMQQSDKGSQVGDRVKLSFLTMTSILEKVVSLNIIGEE